MLAYILTTLRVVLIGGHIGEGVKVYSGTVVGVVAGLLKASRRAIGALMVDTADEQ